MYVHDKYLSLPISCLNDNCFINAISFVVVGLTTRLTLDISTGYIMSWPDHEDYIFQENRLISTGKQDLASVEALQISAQ